ncbi:MAG: glycosyltransferase family 39 protein [Rhodospirillales bacterium]|nr:glycosyltransferase family 39 protein [Rhodospirillales bacterium]
MIAQGLRCCDVHPPLYFWVAALWRRIAGASAPGLGLLPIRLLSAIAAMLALSAIAAIACAADIAPALAVLLTAGCYAFAYTAFTARDFAVAEAFLLAGLLAALRTTMADTGRAAMPRAMLCGLLLGAACFTNYLAVFTAGTVLLWLLIRRPRAGILALLACAAFLPAGGYFFLAQRNARPGQFPRFSLPHALELLARDTGAALFGGLPEYMPADMRALTVAALGLVLCAIAAAMIACRPRPYWNASRLLLASCFLAQLAGLLMLGLVFDNTPIEIRYLCFLCPFFGILAAACVQRRGLPHPAGLAVLAIQAAAVLGLLFMPQTMQPIEPTLRIIRGMARPGSVALIPYGDDGVGVAGALVNGAPGGLPVLVFRDLSRLPALSDRAQLLLVDMRTDQASIREADAIATMLRHEGWVPQQHGTQVIVYRRSSKNTGRAKHCGTGKNP